jgi:hypothetical protein
VIFFWTEKLESHLIGAHKKIMAFKAKYPNWEFIAINLNDNHQEWLNALKHFDFKGTTELHSKDFEDLKAKWAITKIHRTIVIDNNGKIKNAFANIFDVNFEDNFK